MSSSTGVGDSLALLPVSQLASARRRLATVALVFGVVFNVACLGSFGWFAWGGPNWVAHTQDIDLVTANLWLMLAIVARLGAVSDLAVLRLGQAVVIGSGLSLALLHGFNHVPLGEPVPALTWATVWIAVYPLMVPSSPRRTIGVVAAATAAAPVGVALGTSLAGVFSTPDVVASAVGPAVAAVVAVVGSELIHRTTVDIGALQDREALLNAVLQGVDETIVLRDPAGRTVFASSSDERFAGLPAGLFVHETPERAETWLIVHSPVELGEQVCRLTVARRITEALEDAEVDAWKRLIRALSHELNNSLAPMASLLHSADQMVDRPEHRDRLRGAIASLRRRVDHLSEFLAAYVGFARLPAPRPEWSSWTALVDALQPLQPFVVVGELPERGWFDPAQVEQVLLNLLKNASESGSVADEVSLRVAPHDDGWLVEVADRGQGLSDEVARQAVLPFFSTKETGTGLGLALSREIVVAHRGWLALSRREGGGAVARVWLPLR